MAILDEWVNPYYRKAKIKKSIQEDMLSRPYAKYVCLDNFFNEEKLEQLIKHHKQLAFSEEKDRRCHQTGMWLPYDGAMLSPQKNVHFGSDLFYSKVWHNYLASISALKLTKKTITHIKLRYHRPFADGFWIHSDSGLRKLVAIGYFNKDWTMKDGGLLQLWKVESTKSPDAFKVLGTPVGRMDFLSEHHRLRINAPGGGFDDNRAHDVSLVDQILPKYNRLFVSNFLLDETYHSVTPSGPKERLGFVQWLL